MNTLRELNESARDSPSTPQSEVVVALTTGQPVEVPQVVISGLATAANQGADRPFTRTEVEAALGVKLPNLVAGVFPLQRLVQAFGDHGPFHFTKSG